MLHASFLIVIRDKIYGTALMELLLL